METKGYFQRHSNAQGDVRIVYLAIASLIVVGSIVAYRRYKELEMRAGIISSAVKGGNDLNEIIHDQTLKDNEIVIHLKRVLSGSAKIGSLPF